MIQFSEKNSKLIRSNITADANAEILKRILQIKSIINHLLSQSKYLPGRNSFLIQSIKQQLNLVQKGNKQNTKNCIEKLDALKDIIDVLSIISQKNAEESLMKIKSILKNNRRGTFNCGKIDHYTNKGGRSMISEMEQYSKIRDSLTQKSKQKFLTPSYESSLSNHKNNQIQIHETYSIDNTCYDIEEEITQDPLQYYQQVVQKYGIADKYQMKRDRNARQRRLRTEEDNGSMYRPKRNLYLDHVELEQEISNGLKYNHVISFQGFDNVWKQNQDQIHNKIKSNKNRCGTQMTKGDTSILRGNISKVEKKQNGTSKEIISNRESGRSYENSRKGTYNSRNTLNQGKIAFNRDSSSNNHSSVNIHNNEPTNSYDTINQNKLPSSKNQENIYRQSINSRFLKSQNSNKQLLSFSEYPSSLINSEVPRFTKPAISYLSYSDEDDENQRKSTNSRSTSNKKVKKFRRSSNFSSEKLSKYYRSSNVHNNSSQKLSNSKYSRKIQSNKKNKEKQLSSSHNYYQELLQSEINNTQQSYVTKNCHKYENQIIDNIISYPNYNIKNLTKIRINRILERIGKRILLSTAIISDIQYDKSEKNQLQIDNRVKRQKRQIRGLIDNIVERKISVKKNISQQESKKQIWAAIQQIRKKCQKL